MARGLVTLLWIVDGAPQSSAHVRDVAEKPAFVLDVMEDALESALSQARARGAVVAIGPSTALAEMLELGADEAVSWMASSEAIAEAIGRARARASWRATNRDAESPELAGLAFMSAAIGHEIRNPLAAAMINCTTVETLVGETDTQSDLHGALTDLNEALRSIALVVSQMVSLADSGEAGVCDLSRTLVELTTYVHKEVELAADFEVEIPDEPCPVALSRTRAVEIVASILNNAVYAVERAKSRRGEITLRLTIENEMIVIDVTDNGTGMSSEVRKQAINPFYTTRRPGVLGMGLTFAAMHVRRAGGEILIDSELGEGTSVRLFLPRIHHPEPSARVIN